MSQSVYLDAGTYSLSFLAAQRGGGTRRITRKSRCWSTAPRSALVTPTSTSLRLVPDVEFHGNGRDAHHRVPRPEPAGRRQHGLRRRGGDRAAGELDQRRQLRGAGTGRRTPSSTRPTARPGSSPAAAGVSSNGSAFTSGNPNAPDGSQVAFLQGTGSMSQSVYLDAGTYSLSFLAAQRAGVPDALPGDPGAGRRRPGGPGHPRQHQLRLVPDAEFHGRRPGCTPSSSSA